MTNDDTRWRNPRGERVLNAPEPYKSVRLAGVDDDWHWERRSEFYNRYRGDISPEDVERWAHVIDYPETQLDWQDMFIVKPGELPEEDDVYEATLEPGSFVTLVTFIKENGWFHFGAPIPIPYAWRHRTKGAP